MPPTLSTVPDDLEPRLPRRVPRTLTVVTTAMARHGRAGLPDLAADPAGRRNELDEVARKRRGQRRHRAGPDHQELGPAEQERRQRPIRLAEVDVRPSRLRQHRPELGQRQRPGRAEEPADDPDQDDRRRCTGRRGPRSPAR